MKTSRLFLTVFLVFAFQTITVHSQLKLEIGDKYESRYEIETASVVNYRGEKIDTEQKYEAWGEIGVDGITDGLYELIVKTTFLKVNIKQMEQEYSYDSSKEEDLNNPIWTEMKDILNARTTLKMNSRGEVEDLGGGFDLQKMGSESGVFLVFPEGLSVGTSWTVKSDTETRKQETTYTAREISDTAVVLSVDGTMDILQIGDADGVESTTRSVGTFTGEIEVEKSTYLILESTRLMDLDVTVEAMGESVPAATTTRIKETNRKL